jgi:hypothetical protein
MKAIDFDDVNQRILSSQDNIIYQKVLIDEKETWIDFQYTFYRGTINPANTLGINGDIYLNDNSNIIFEKKNNVWSENDKIDIYFTNNKMSSKDGEIGSLNCLTGIFEIGPVVKFGNGENITFSDREDGLIYLKDYNKRLFIRTSLGEYQIRYEDEKPSQAHSITNAILFNSDIWDTYIRKSVY